jgi:cell division protein DivIC
MKFLRLLTAILRNKYLLTITVFAVWMLFFDKNDVFTLMQRRRDLGEIENSKAYFSQKIVESKKFSKDIQSDAAAIEKFARERYLMKRENEDLFLIQSPEKE